ncbi:hypothetical protein AB0C34_23675 [Nocardia sp. NPDC049220]|uniref:hypothetical protein n=1 Tax=Nocardia sp. NPDC049220 TaxID=3155273 RepID=UPI0033F6CF7A
MKAWYVHPNWHSTGVGRDLMQTALHRLGTSLSILKQPWAPRRSNVVSGTDSKCMGNGEIIRHCRKVRGCVHHSWR